MSAAAGDRADRWETVLDWLRPEFADLIRPWLGRMDRLLGDRLGSPREGQDLVDGYAGLARRGPLHRMTPGSRVWALVDGDELVRRYQAGELLHYDVSRVRPPPPPDVLWLIDLGPRHLGAPRLAQLVMALVLWVRTREQGCRLSWGLLQAPGRTHVLDGPSSLRGLWQARADGIANREHVAAWAAEAGEARVLAWGQRDPRWASSLHLAEGEHGLVLRSDTAPQGVSLPLRSRRRAAHFLLRGPRPVHWEDARAWDGVCAARGARDGLWCLAASGVWRSTSDGWSRLACADQARTVVAVGREPAGDVLLARGSRGMLLTRTGREPQLFSGGAWPQHVGEGTGRLETMWPVTASSGPETAGLLVRDVARRLVFLDISEGASRVVCEDVAGWWPGEHGVGILQRPSPDRASVGWCWGWLSWSACVSGTHGASGEVPLGAAAPRVETSEPTARDNGQRWLASAPSTGGDVHLAMSEDGVNWAHYRCGASVVRGADFLVPSGMTALGLVEDEAGALGLLARAADGLGLWMVQGFAKRRLLVRRARRIEALRLTAPGVFWLLEAGGTMSRCVATATASSLVLERPV